MCFQPRIFRLIKFTLELEGKIFVGSPRGEGRPKVVSFLFFGVMTRTHTKSIQVKDGCYSAHTRSNLFPEKNLRKTFRTLIQTVFFCCEYVDS